MESHWVSFHPSSFSSSFSSPLVYATQSASKGLRLKLDLTPKTKWRLMGIFPLIFFFAQAVHYWRISQVGNLAWMCNIGNLVLALGFFFDKPVLIRISAIWTIPGLFIWLKYVVFAWGVFFSSTLAHLGGLTFGMLGIRRVGMDRKSWLYALGWFFLLQIFARLFTSPDLNVNLAHRIQDGLEPTFGSYPAFWLTLTIVTGIVLWMLGLLLRRLWPMKLTDG
jgi:hypothetical protein